MTEPAHELRRPRVYVAGHGGLAGSAVWRALERRGARPFGRRSAELDLRDLREVERLFEVERPELVFLAAARAGGLSEHRDRPADMLADNLLIQTNVVTASRRAGARLVFLASSAVYPRLAEQPLREDSLWSGPPDPSVDAYAVAKLAGLKLIEAHRRQHGARFVSALATNLYGPGDRYGPGAHVVASLIERFHAAKLEGRREVTVWGTGRARRDLLHADDLADACLLLADLYDDDRPINVGTGQDVTIAELAALVARVVGFEGRIAFDAAKPEGAPRRLLDVTRLSDLGWRPRIDLESGLRDAYRGFLESSTPTGAGPVAA